MIDIPQNNYTPITEIREEVMDRLLTSLLYGRDLTVESRYNFVDKYIEKRMNGYKEYSLRDHSYISDLRESFDDYYKMHSCEVRKALSILKDKGYYVWRNYHKGTLSYYVTRQPKPWKDNSRQATDADFAEINID